MRQPLPPQAAACDCLRRLLTKHPRLTRELPLGAWIAKHSHPDATRPHRVWHIDWESVLAEAILACVPRIAV